MLVKATDAAASSPIIITAGKPSVCARISHIYIIFGVNDRHKTITMKNEIHQIHNNKIRLPGAEPRTIKYYSVFGVVEYWNSILLEIAHTIYYRRIVILQYFRALPFA